MPILGHAFALVYFLLFIAFWVGVIALGVWIALRLVRRSPAESALRILNERFARGEIDQQEFETRKAVLRKAR